MKGLTAVNPVLSICERYRLQLADYSRTGLRVGIWASSGRGKSFGVGVFCEELLNASIPVIAIDPEGELHTLREQFRVLVLGGEHADLPLPTGSTGVRLALNKALDEGLGLVVDLSDRPTNKAQQETAKPWLEQLWILMSERRAPAALVVEEVHIFAPQSGSAVTADMMQRFAKQGRKRGAILVAASQRTQAVSKEFMSQLNFPAIGGFETERDYEAVKAVVDGHTFDEFRTLEPGSFFLSAASDFDRWRPRQTSHGGEAPTWTAAETVENRRRDSTLDALVEQLRAAFDEEAVSEQVPDPGAEARLRIRQLEQELQKAQAALEAAQSEVQRLNIALQVMGLVKVVIQQEVIALAPSLPVPAVAAQAAGSASPLSVVRAEAKPAEPALVKDVRINPDKLVELAQVKVMIRRARDRARRRSSRSTDYMHAAVQTLAYGFAVTAEELAARYGYYGKVTINRMGHVLDALAEVGFAANKNGQYRLNEAYLRQVIMRSGET